MPINNDTIRRRRLAREAEERARARAARPRAVLAPADRWTFNDGGRADAGFKGAAGDCVTRAIAIATGKPYREVYDDLTAASKARAATYRGKRKSFGTARTGQHREIFQPYLESLGWEWVPTMQIGQGCTVHLTPEELPDGTIIASVSRHLVTVIDGVAHDTHDPTRDGKRCVYGYFRRAK